MRFKKESLTLLLFSFFILLACHKPSSQNGNEYQAQKSQLSKDIPIVGTKYLKPEMRDSIKTLPCPGCQIDRQKVDSVLQTVGLSHFSLVHTKKPADLKEVIRKLKKLLRKQVVTNDQELQFYYNLMLAGAYYRFFYMTGKGNNDYLHKAIKYSKKALSIFKNNPKYKADIIGPYGILINAYAGKKDYEKAISLLEYIIEKYQNIGVGPYKNWYAVTRVQILENLLNKNMLKPDQAEEVIQYLKGVGHKYQNEVGIAAQIVVQRHYLELGKKEKVNALTKSIENGLASLNNERFKRDVWFPEKARIKRFRNKKTRQKGVRDTVYYAIKPEMIKTMSIHKLKGVDRYQINVQLKKKYWSEYRKLTTENIGNSLAIKFKGEVISPGYPVLQTSILRGSVVIGVFKSRKKAKRVVQKIRK